MRVEENIVFPKGATHKEQSDLLRSKLDEIRKKDGKIISAEPIQETEVTIIGQRFTVEY